MKKCEYCETHQQQLLDDGDGSQVVCDHLDSTDIEGDASTTTTTTCTDTKSEQLEAEQINTTATTRRKRKFLTDYEFDRMGDDRVKRKIAPIQKWRDLIVRNVYRVVKVHDMNVNIKGKEQLSHYGEFEDSNERLINVWLTNIIHDELEKYNLETGNIYLKSLGKAKSVASGMDYHDFVIVVDKN